MIKIESGFKLIRVSTDAARHAVVEAAVAFRATFAPGISREDQGRARQRLFLALIALDNTEPS